MALSKVNAAVAALIEETKVSTVDKLVHFLGQKIEIDEDMKKMFEEFKEVSKVVVKGAKGAAKAEKKEKRAPSAYNLYIKDKIAEFKAAGHKGNLMKMATDAWNESKKAAAASTPSS
jgi:hypothetical protein